MNEYNYRVALRNAAYYDRLSVDCVQHALQLPEPHKGWANSDAILFADKAVFYHSQAAQIASAC